MVMGITSYVGFTIVRQRLQYEEQKMRFFIGDDRKLKTKEINSMEFQ